MKTCAASILLLVLSLAGLSVAATSDDSIKDVIRLPSDNTGFDDPFKTMRHDEETRPWECCNHAVCTYLPRKLPMCQCVDKVDQCSSACENCEETTDSRYTCSDVYYGDPGPVCKTRPWKCCNKQVCTRSSPPTCRCLDIVKHCDKACKYCEEVKGGHRKRYSCLDAYFGDMAPPCGMQRGDGAAQVRV